VDELRTYFEQELNFVRQMGAEFAKQHPKIAGRLLLEPNRCEDPHVERLIQAFALLAARIRYKLEDDFPQLTDALLEVLYPHYLAPLPSFSIAEFVCDPDQGKMTEGHTIDRGAVLNSKPVTGVPCRFRTCYPTTLWPLQVTSARFDSPDRLNPPARAASVLRIELKCLAGTTLAELEKLDRLRFFLNGEGPLVHNLYELIFCNVRGVQVRALSDGKDARYVSLPPASLHEVGFGPEEGILPYSGRSFLGYRLLQEYFAYPEKFLFFDVVGLKPAVRAGLGAKFEILVFLDLTPKIQQQVSGDTFRLGCSPIVNLYSKVSDPIRLDRSQIEYRVIPDVGRQNATEVYAIESVVSTSPALPEPITFQPFYSYKHTADHDGHEAFWYARRTPSPRKDDGGTDVHISMVDLNFRPSLPPVETLTIRATCTNRDLPGKLPLGRVGGLTGDLSLEGRAPLSRINCLIKPTATLRPPLHRGAQWRLLSHLSLNYLSICEGGREALQEILRLYDFQGSAEIQHQIDGIIDVRSQRVVRRPAGMPWNGFCRGLETTIQFDETRYAGSGVFLFAAVLERFLGLYCSMNSFSQLVAVTTQREEPLKRWPPRAGNQILL
jgi:type VI secretion system protein ImpG